MVKLTATLVKDAMGGDKNRKLADSGGLLLLIHINGTKRSNRLKTLIDSWQFSSLGYLRWDR